MTGHSFIEVNKNLRMTTTYPSIKDNKIIYVELISVRMIILSCIVYVK